MQGLLREGFDPAAAAGDAANDGNTSSTSNRLRLFEATPSHELYPSPSAVAAAPVAAPRRLSRSPPEKSRL